MDPLLLNAASSLKMGIEDYESSQPERVISGVRNVTAGVLLLFKEKLRRLSPPDSNEALLKAQIHPTLDDKGAVRFMGVGKKTVDVQQIRQRFVDLSVSVDWDRVSNIVRIRNEVEHYYTGQSEGRLRELISDTFIVVRDFLTTHLALEPADVLDASTWSTMLNWAEVYEQEQMQCQAALDTVQWPDSGAAQVAQHLRCTNCYSELVKPENPTQPFSYDIMFRCSSCGERNLYEDMVEDGVQEYLGADAHIAIKDGGDPPFGTCPECFKDTYLFDADRCAACGYQREYLECTICHNSLSLEDQEYGGLCSYHQWVADKEAER